MPVDEIQDWDMVQIWWHKVGNDGAEKRGA